MALVHGGGGLPVLLLALFARCANAQTVQTTLGSVTYDSVAVIGPEERARLAEEVRQEFLFCWNAYKKYAWGHDELRPMSRTGSDWYGVSFLMTPADALDTMILMGFTQEADSAREYLCTHLSFDRDVYVSNFEFTIRFLGGLLSSYQLTGDERLLRLAVDLANRELPAFRSPTGMPYGDVNLKTGAVRRNVTNPAEIGTLLVEFGTLTRLTGDSTYFNVAKNAVVQLFKRRSSIGLVGEAIDVTTGAWVDSDCSVSGGIDSYYEYLLKCSILFDDRDCAAMWRASIGPIDKYLHDSTSTGTWYGHADMNTGKRTATEFGSLDAFFGATLALGGKIEAAERLQTSAFAMWNRYGIEPEQFNYATMTAVAPEYYLRPEIMESAYYLYQYTHSQRYLAMGKVFLENLKKWCRTNSGYVRLKSVVSKEQMDGMPSYFLAETLKYLYLLFKFPPVVNFDRIIFNTEAHLMLRSFQR